MRCVKFTTAVGKEKLTDWHKANSHTASFGIEALLDQPIDDFNGINLIEIVSEDGGNDNLIVSKISL